VLPRALEPLGSAPSTLIANCDKEPQDDSWAAVPWRGGRGFRHSGAGRGI